MIYRLTLAARQEAVESLLKKQGYDNKSSRWHKKGDYNGIEVIFEPTYTEEYMGKFSVRLNVPNSPRFDGIVQEYGLKAGVNGRNQDTKLSVLENILKDLADNRTRFK
ncbi:hypothetical protein HZA33_01600 [Candidatus Pacearchaeota archaeon]|nr:hypothetical protein [Candidatus Pacearchaeota archaeon]